MRGKELAKLLTCIIDEQKVKWGRDTMFDSHSDRYCALGLLAKGAGVPDDELADESWPSWFPESQAGDLKKIPGINDNAKSFVSLMVELGHSKLKFPVRKYLKACKRHAKELKQKREV